MFLDRFSQIRRLWKAESVPHPTQWVSKVNNTFKTHRNAIYLFSHVFLARSKSMTPIVLKLSGNQEYKFIKLSCKFQKWTRSGFFKINIFRQKSGHFQRSLSQKGLKLQTRILHIHIRWLFPFLTSYHTSWYNHPFWKNVRVKKTPTLIWGNRAHIWGNRPLHPNLVQGEGLRDEELPWGSDRVIDRFIPNSDPKKLS